MVLHQDAEVSKDKKAFLKVEHVSKRFGGVKALEDAGLSCNKGETHVLIGENGAGKSTIVKIICGVLQKDNGNIYIDGKEVDINCEQAAEKNKIAAVFQELSLIEDLSVAENIFLGHEFVNRFGKINFSKMYEESDRFLKEIGVSLNSRYMVRDLTLCEKQLVEIAKALYKKPEVLILDEATSALGEKEVKWLFRLIKKFTKEQNNTIIFISHRMDELNQVADRATIFRDAHFILTFNWGELSDEQIVTYISGKERVEADLQKNIPLSNEAVLEVDSASRGSELHNIKFQLKKGEILGIAGLAGQGQIELIHSLFGDGTFETGSIKVNGTPVQIRNQKDALKNGIVLVPEDRKNEGLMLIRSIRENISLMSLEKIHKLGVIISRQEQNNIDDSVRRLQIKASDVNLEVSSLSGGNQQKVLLSKALLTNPKILLLSDPTRGIDIGTKYEIYKLMEELTREGMSIIFYTTQTSELLLMCSRILVFYEGRIASELTGENVTEENIIAESIGVGGKKNER